MYSKTCASRTCFNTSRTRPDLTFFSFPKSEQFIRAWAEACSSPELENKSPDQLTQLYLCAEHFEDKCFTDPKEKTTLIKWKDIYSIPTIFNHNAPDPAEHNSGLQGTNPMLKLLLKGCTNSRLQKICRLCSCLKPTQCLVPIYGSYYQPLMVKLQPFGIFLSLNDGLPSHICRTCAAKLLLCVETLEQFHESELKLKLAGSTDISTITYDPGILDKNVINNDRNEANENNISISVPTSSQQEEPEKEHLDSINNFEVEDMAMNDGNNENLVKVEVMDEESNTLDSNEIDIDLPIVKQEVEIEEVSPTNDENFGESTLPHPVSFIDFQEFATISNEKEQTTTVLEHDPLSDEFRTTCKHCRRIFISTAFLMKHIEKEHVTAQTSPDIVKDPKVKEYKCKVCNAMLSSAIAYLSHLKMHAAKTPGIEITNLRSQVFPSTSENSFSNVAEHKDVDEAEDSPRKFRKVSLLRRTAKKDFKCDFCELTFPKKDELCAHFNIHKLFLCDTCGDKFWRQEDFQEHMETHKPVITDRYINKPFRIEIENTLPVQNIQVKEKETTGENNVDKSTNLEVEEESVICFVDVPIKEEKFIPIVDIEEDPNSKDQILSKSEYKSKDETENEEDSKDTNGLVNVSDESSEESDPQLKVEIEKVLADRHKMYVCENCAAIFSTKFGVTSHIYKEHPNDTISKNSYKKHEVDNKFLCAICNLSFGTVGDYELHLKRHMNASFNLPRNVCSICGYKFSSEKMYKLHMRNHMEKGYEEKKPTKHGILDLSHLQCRFCGEQFSTNFMLMTHLKSAHMLSCIQCNEKFETDESFKNHMRKTHQESMFICNICGDHFASDESIYKHIVKHGTGKTENLHDKLEKPLRCKICHATLKTMYMMKCHMDKHSGVKDAFACDKCEMRFDICSKLDEHRRKHEPKVDFDRPYACTVCGNKYILETALKRHYVREHFTHIASVTNGKRKLLESQIMEI
ncbi:zinc finger protein 521-like isoform X2 [Belonocnema kinseyi]|uniref:zinc finger protein 521-like isoform X2 n=1 Tax=Belonocnema kinseyi TaxID=2817044 RepID=UPI00143D719D|nr:zinc finger protein 521-like isoform X2 [Belonocnema kinseyi]